MSFRKKHRWRRFCQAVENHRFCIDEIMMIASLLCIIALFVLARG